MNIALGHSLELFVVIHLNPTKLFRAGESKIKKLKIHKKIVVTPSFTSSSAVNNDFYDSKPECKFFKCIILDF